MYSLLHSQDRSPADECMMWGDVQPVGPCWSWSGAVIHSLLGLCSGWCRRRDRKAVLADQVCEPGKCAVPVQVLFVLAPVILTHR